MPLLQVTDVPCAADVRQADDRNNSKQANTKPAQQGHNPDLLRMRADFDYKPSNPVQPQCISIHVP